MMGRKSLGYETYLCAFEVVVVLFRNPLLTIISVVHNHDVFPSLHVHTLVTAIVCRVILAFTPDYRKRISAHVGDKIVDARIEYG